MKNAEKMDNPSVTAEQNLPSAAFSAARPAAAAVSGTPIKPARASQLSPAAGESQTATAVLPVSLPDAAARQSVTAVASATAPASHAAPVDRVEHLIGSLVVRLKNLGADSLSVVVKPDLHTELFLKLTSRGGTVEAAAELHAGDYAAFNAQWHELQQRLESQGVRLAPLARHPGQTGAGDAHLGQSQHRSSRPDTALVESGAPSGRITSVKPAPRPVRRAPSRFGWESWA